MVGGQGALAAEGTRLLLRVKLIPCLLPQHCTCVDDCSSSNCLCGQLSIRCWYDKVRSLHLLPATSHSLVNKGAGQGFGGCAARMELGPCPAMCQPRVWCRS